jgi:predicted acylesterase/phospholipase RssA
MEIECLVLSGGGHLGFIELGALYHLEKEQFWDRKKVKSIYATSIGTVIAVLIAVNLDWDIINDYMIKRPWDKIFEIKSTHIFQLFDTNGIYDENISLQFIKPILDALDLPQDISLKDFFEITKIEINFFSFNFTLCETIKINYINFPDLPLYKAIYMSCCVPIFFKPFIWNEEVYIDGGMESNYPIKYALEYYKEENIFSFKINYSKLNYSVAKDTNFFAYLSSIVMYNITKNNQLNERFKNEIIYECSIDEDIKYVIEFLSSFEKRQLFFDKGVEIGTLFLTNIKS